MQDIISGEVRVDALYEDVRRVIRKRQSSMNVDRDWYLKTQEDAMQRTRQGPITSPRQHFVDHGNFQRRKSCPITVNGCRHLMHKDDVAERSRRGTSESDQAHFGVAGGREGRMPRER